jgi:hypothetical protein
MPVDMAMKRFMVVSWHSDTHPHQPQPSEQWLSLNSLIKQLLARAISNGNAKTQSG